MSPRGSEAFERCWPDVAQQLEVILLRRGIDAHAREDLIQETALRLLQRWEDLDHHRPLVPLAATVALNLMRDGYRKRRHEVERDLEVTPQGDVEREGLARLELARVGRALRSLSPAHREVLLAGVAEPPVVDEARVQPLPASGRDRRTPVATLDGERSKAATKMLRMRARRRLAAVLETTAVVAGGARLRVWRLFNDPSQTAAALGASAVLASALILPVPRNDSRQGVERSRSGGVTTPAQSPTSPARSPSTAAFALGGSPSGSAPQGQRLPEPAVALPPTSAAPGAPDEPPEDDVSAAVSADPTGGDNDEKIDAGVAQARLTSQANQSYAVCASVRVGPVEDDACNDGG